MASEHTAPETVTIPMPLVRPFATPINAQAVQEVWDAYVKPEQDAEIPPSIEMRILMAILRAVYVGLTPSEEAIDGT